MQKMEKIMSKTEYLHTLEKHLRRLPSQDRQKALEYFEEYFAEAGEGQEAQAIENLGSPETAAEQLFTELAIKNSTEPVKTIRKGMRGVRIGILALIAAPVALPFTIVLLAALFVLLMAVLLVFVMFFLSGAFLMFSGISSLLCSLTVIAGNPATALGALGLGLAALGLGWIVIVAMCCLTKACLGGMTRLFGRFAQKHSGKEKKHE